MLSKFELNTFRKKRLKELLKTLFPEYDVIRIKNNGLILFGKKYFKLSFIKQRVHVSELCIDEIPKRLAKYRHGNIGYYVQTINTYLDHIINNNVCNIIDFLYKEYSNIKSSSRVDILLEDSQFSLPESNPDSETIGTILNKVIRNNNISDIIGNLNRLYPKESIRDQYCRVMFLIKNKI